MHKTIKRTLFFYLFFIPTVCAKPNIEKDMYQFPVAVVIMVKDEVDVIIPTLQPLIDGGIDAILVYDTGSTDGTQDIINNYFQKNDLIHGHIIEEPFVDFATSRNRSLDYAEELFPNITFFLMLDAEWYTHNAGEILEFCEQYQNYVQPGTDGGCYAIRLITASDNIDNYATRLMRREKKARYCGVVHESIKQIVSGRLPQSVYFEYCPKETGQLKSQQRFLRDYQLLKKELEKNPYDERTLFYLGQTCQFLNLWDEAILYYYQRAQLGFISEERYLALYRIGCAIEYIIFNEKNNKNNYTWENALFYYLKAHTMLPHRAEPLVRIAAYYIYTKQYPVAYLFAQRAAQLPYPLSDVLFVEKSIYDYTRYDYLGQCALYVGEYELGKNAVLKALEINSDQQHLHHNLSVYNQYLAVI